MSVLYLIRHGRTPANDAHQYCGSSDISLSPAGVEELSGLRYAVGSVRFLTSGMRRTNETLRILFGEVPFAEVPAFREIDFGDFELHTYTELKDNPAYQAWITGDNEANVPPNGESGVEMTRRVREALPSLLTEDTVLVTHGGVIAAIMSELFPGEGKNRYEWQPKPGHGYRVTEEGYFPIP